MSNTWYADFRLSITRALTDQLVTTLEPLKPAPLTKHRISEVQPRPGVYILFLNGERVYVGKASQSLRDRLSHHQRKLSGRTRIAIESVQFTCAYVDEDLDAAAPEKLLIKKYRATDSIPWNTNGFGNKDPGRNRDRSIVKAKHFDACYPINLDVTLQFDSRTLHGATLLETIKRTLPYLLRYDNSGRAKGVLRRTAITLSKQTMTTRQVIAEVISALPTGWQATALPGYIILYPETSEYDSALLWWRRSPNGTVEETVGPQQFASGEVGAAERDESVDEHNQGILSLEI